MIGHGKEAFILYEIFLFGVWARSVTLSLYLKIEPGPVHVLAQTIHELRAHLWVIHLVGFLLLFPEMLNGTRPWAYCL